MTVELIREFTVAVFVVHDERVLLLWHPKLARWLPPGGHIEPNELPDEAAVREVEEETGVRVRLVGGRGVPVDEPRQLVLPVGIQLENIKPGVQHIDLVYFAVPLDGGHEVSPECVALVRAGWVGRSDFDRLGLDDEIRLWCDRALGEMQSMLPTPRSMLLPDPSGGILSE